MTTTNGLIAEGIQELTTSAAFYRDQGEAFEQSRLDMVAQANTTSEAIISQLTPIFNAVTIYVDSAAGAGGDGTSANPYNDLVEAFTKIPAGKATDILVRGDHTLNPGANATQNLYSIDLNFRLIQWDGDKPTMTIPHIDHATNGFSYPSFAFATKMRFHMEVHNVDIVIQASPNNQPTPDSNAFIYPYWGAVLEFSSSNSDITVPAGMSLISPYVLSLSASLQIGYGLFSGGGDIITNLYDVPSSLHANGVTIANDTYFFKRMRADRRNLITNYLGAQLARTTD